MEAVPSKNPSAQSAVENEEFWKRHAELHKASGLTRTNYCRLHNVNYDRFGYWLSKWSHQSSSLVAIKLKPKDESIRQATLCTLSLSNGRTLQIHDQQSLSYILERLV